MEEHTIRDNQIVPFSVRLMFGAMVFAGVLSVAIGLFYLEPSQMAFEALQRSPIAGRLGSFVGTFVFVTVFFWLPGYFIFKRGKKSLYFCMGMSVLAIAIVIYGLLNGRIPSISNLKITNVVALVSFLVAYLFLPGLTLYIWFRHRGIFLKQTESSPPATKAEGS